MRFILSVLFILGSIVSFAGTLKGKVTDQKGDPLPYATIYLEGTTIGASANGNGEYEINIAPGLYKVICQYVGYKQSTYNLTITGNEVITRSFALRDESLEMKEVVIHANAEDPAYAIIRNAIKKREDHLQQVKTFQSSIYFKGVFRTRELPKKVMGKKIDPADAGLDTSGKGVLYLTEEDADYYADGGNERTVIHSVHESGNKNGVGFSQFPPVISFYENNVSVLGKNSRGFISPISDNALLYYRYKYLGEFMEGGNRINKIEVRSRRLYEPCFTGTIYIVEDDWAIHSLDMLLEKKSGMDMFDTIKLNQVFVPLGKDRWVIKSEIIYVTLKFFGFDITGSEVVVYNKQKINEKIADSLFKGNVIGSYDKNANKKDSIYWENRPVPLQEDEQRDFVVKDSINKIHNSPAYTDSIRRRDNKIKPLDLLISGRLYYSKGYKNRYSTNSPFIGLGDPCMVNYNIVEGYTIAPRLSVRHEIDSFYNLYADAAVRYGFANRHINAIGRLYRTDQARDWKNRSWMYGVEGGKYVFQYSPDNPVNEFINSYSALFYRQNEV